MKVSVKQIGLGILAFILLLLSLGSFYVVDQGERAVITRFGEVVNIAEPGLGFKWPVLESTRKISVQEQLIRYSTVETYSRDQQPTTMSISIRYQIDPGRVGEVYSNFGTAEQLLARQVTPTLLEQTKAVFGTYNAVESIQRRGALNQNIADAVQADVTGPIIILGVQVEDIAFSRAYEESVEQRMLAEVAVERERQNGLRELELAEIKRTQARAEADRVRFLAEAEADSITMRGEAEANAIRARAEALGQNPNLVELVKAERWNGTLPTTVLPNGTVPFIEAN